MSAVLEYTHATVDEVLDVLFFKEPADRLNRDFCYLMDETAMGAWHTEIYDDSDAMHELLTHIGQHLDELPLTKARLTLLAKAAQR